MKKCTNCGKELNDTAAFCEACGTNLNTGNAVPAEKPKKKKRGCLVFIVVAIVVVALCAMCSSSDTEQPATNNATTSEESAAVPEQEQVAEKQDVEVKTEKADDVPTEYKSALRKAETYSEMMHMSKAGIYDQLVSEYGENFSPEAAQYAIDNLDADWKYNALKKAELYQNDMAMSPEAIRDQLTSEYGEQFTQEEADYAVANLK